MRNADDHRFPLGLHGNDVERRTRHRRETRDFVEDRQVFDQQTRRNEDHRLGPLNRNQLGEERLEPPQRNVGLLYGVKRALHGFVLQQVDAPLECRP